MSPNNRQPGESDLDQTDQLPILEGEIADQDMQDDAVPLEQAARLRDEIQRLRHSAFGMPTTLTG